MISLLRFTLLLHRARRVKNRLVPHWVRVVESREVQNSCSWMRWVVLSPNDRGREAILQHECAHLLRGHSWDKILCELTCRTLWFLPFAWMLRQDLADVHEFEADRAVLLHGTDKIEYNMLLIEKAAHRGLQPVVNAFNESKTAKRMKMMFKKKSTRASMLKALYVLPLAACAIVAFAKPEVVNEMEVVVQQETAALMPKLLTSPSTSLAIEEGEVQNTNVITLSDSVVISTLRSDTPSLLEQGIGDEIVHYLDSTMSAVGARKIAEGVYVGSFQPNFSSDTIRVATVWLDNDQSEHVEEYRFCESAVGTYNIDLQWEDREHLGRGWHIRWMKPAVEADAQRQQYHRNTPAALSASLHGMDAQHLRVTPNDWGWLEEGKDETIMVLMVPADDLDDSAVELSTEHFCLCDEASGDRYVCRGVRIYDMDAKPFTGQRIRLERKGNSSEPMSMRLVFPKLDKNVKRVAFGFMEEDVRYMQFYSVKDLMMKSHKIIP